MKDNSQKPKVIAIIGTTSSGKTALSLELARRFSGEIISADSRQVYQGLTIGTGKILPEEMQDIPHHLIDVARPDTRFSVADFTAKATTAIDEILKHHHIPFVVGGTGMYVSALLEGITFPEIQPNEKLRNELEQKTTEELFALLESKDPRRAETIDPENKRRLIRALEIVDAIGRVPELSLQESPYDVLWIGLELPKELLQQKIRARIDNMIDRGLIHEVETLIANGISHERLQELGLEYRHIADYLQGNYTNLGSMIDDLATKTWQYAKRQLTWFKRNQNIQWFNPETDKEKILRMVDDFKL